MDDIICPNCGKPVAISQALIHQFQDKIRKEEGELHKLELEKAKEETKAMARKTAKEEAQKDLEAAKSTNRKLEESLITLKKQQEESDRKQKETAEKIREQTTKEVMQSARLEKLELEKKLNDTQKALEDAQRKVKQGSGQLAGEVLELELENKLRQSFPNDEFLPVPKGVEGGDVFEKVRFQGKEVGTILWEFKRTKSWSNNW